MTHVTLKRSSTRALSADGSAGYRADIDGLRALAIVLVVVYHVWLGRVSGGVDVFLMISAFFLTASFVRRATRGVSIDLGSFWLRKFRRLLPAASVTILGVIVIAFLVYPQTDWPGIWREAWASLFYLQNWELAFSNVDYYARDGVTPSPFQHFWSLSVQGQVFILWPVVIALVALITRQRRELVVPALAVVFGAIFVFSLAFSIYETSTAQSFAYFDSRTRLWEFAAGSLVALALPYITLSAVARVVLGWLGVAGIVMCGIVLDVQGGFPGYLALWPVVCTALVIVAGQEEVAGSPTRFLASRPLRFLGRDAYALYLVHWPILITWMVLTERSQPGPLSGLGIIILSFLLARLISWGVERPLRHAAIFERDTKMGGIVVVCAVALVAVPLATWQGIETWRAAQFEAASLVGYPGAAQVDAPIDLSIFDLPLRPAPVSLDQEWVALGAECGESGPQAPSLMDTCLSNELAHQEDAPLILVMGDSHAQQLMSPLRVVADERGWGLMSLLKGGCPIGNIPPSWLTPGVPCEEWREAAISFAETLAPDAVYLVGTRADPRAPEELIGGIDEIVQNFIDRGIEVILVRDSPRFRFDMYECVLADEANCARNEVLAETGLTDLTTADQVVQVDFTPWLCPDGICQGKIGNVAVYMDDNHLDLAWV